MVKEAGSEIGLGQLKWQSWKLKIKQVWLRIRSDALTFSNHLTPDKRITLWVSAPFLPAAIIFTLVSLITGALLIAAILAGVWAVVVGLFILLLVARGDVESVQRDMSKTSEILSGLAPQIDKLEREKRAHKAAQGGYQAQKKAELAEAKRQRQAVQAQQMEAAQQSRQLEMQARAQERPVCRRCGSGAIITHPEGGFNSGCATLGCLLIGPLGLLLGLASKTRSSIKCTSCGHKQRL